MINSGYVKDGGIIPTIWIFTVMRRKGDYSWREIKVEKINGKLKGIISDPIKKPNTVANVR